MIQLIEFYQHARKFFIRYRTNLAFYADPFRIKKHEQIKDFTRFFSYCMSVNAIHSIFFKHNFVSNVVPLHGTEKIPCCCKHRSSSLKERQLRDFKKLSF